MRLILSAFILLSAVLPGHAIDAAAIERGTAIIDPLALRELDHGRFSIGAMVMPERSTDIPLTTGQVFSVGKMAKARAAIDREFAALVDVLRAGYTPMLHPTVRQVGRQ